LRQILGGIPSHNDTGQVINTLSIIWYWARNGDVLRLWWGWA